MFGEPQKMSPAQRNWSYWMMWLGAAASIVLVWSRLAGFQTEKFGPVIGFAVGGMLSVAWNGRTDDYFRSLCVKGQQFLTFFMGSYLLLHWMAITLHDDGVPKGSFTMLLADGYFGAMLAAISFYTGYAWAFLRDRVGQADEE